MRIPLNFWRFTTGLNFFFIKSLKSEWSVVTVTSVARPDFFWRYFTFPQWVVVSGDSISNLSVEKEQGRMPIRCEYCNIFLPVICCFNCNVPCFASLNLNMFQLVLVRSSYLAVLSVKHGETISQLESCLRNLLTNERLPSVTEWLTRQGIQVVFFLYISRGVYWMAVATLLW